MKTFTKIKTLKLSSGMTVQIRRARDGALLVKHPDADASVFGRFYSVPSFAKKYGGDAGIKRIREQYYERYAAELRRETGKVIAYEEFVSMADKLFYVVIVRHRVCVISAADGLEIEKAGAEVA